MTKMDPLPPVHPGEVLREEYLAPLGITSYTLAATLRLPRSYVERLVREETSLTRHTALRLAGYFGTSPEFWLSIQDRFDEHATHRAAPSPKRWARLPLWEVRGLGLSTNIPLNREHPPERDNSGGNGCQAESSAIESRIEG